MVEDFYKKGTGKKSMKSRMDLIPARALIEVGLVFAHGAKKHPEDPMSAKRELKKEFAAMQRHAWKWKAGVKKDADSKLHSLAHVAARALIALEWELRNNPKI